MIRTLEVNNLQLKGIHNSAGLENRYSRPVRMLDKKMPLSVRLFSDISPLFKAI